VLFVEDDPQTRESMVQPLFLNGFRVLAAESALEGCASSRVMPGMSGIK
jgi:DNA-binding response OmpR family regulator